jgi:hypothetical protein
VRRWGRGRRPRFFTRMGALAFFFAGGGLCVLWVLQQNRVVVWGVRSGLLWKGGACGVAEGRLPSRVGYCPKTGIEICRQRSERSE